MYVRKLRRVVAVSALGPLQTKVINFLKSSPGWHDVKSVSEAIGAEYPAVYKCFNTDRMSHIKRREVEIEVTDTKCTRTVLKSEFSLPPMYTHSAEQALVLATRHPGMFGQLYWAAHDYMR